MDAVSPHTEIFNDLLKLAVDSSASDIVIKANKPGYVRISNRLKPVDMDPITNPEAEAFVEEHVPEIFRKRWDGAGPDRLRLCVGGHWALPRQRVPPARAS